MRTLLLVVALAGVGWALDAEAAEQADPAEALAGLKGFVVGELMKGGEKGCVLFVRAVALVEGNAAQSPGVLIGREAEIAFALKEDAKGEKRPDTVLARTVARLKTMPEIQVGGGAGATVVMGVGDGQGMAVAGGVGGAVRMRVQGMDIITDDEGEPARKPKGPLVTVRVRAGDDGKLVMDRVMSGSAMAATWGGMPRLEAAPDAGPVER